VQRGGFSVQRDRIFPQMTKEASHFSKYVRKYWDASDNKRGKNSTLSENYYPILSNEFVLDAIKLAAFTASGVALRTVPKISPLFKRITVSDPTPLN